MNTPRPFSHFVCAKTDHERRILQWVYLHFMGNVQDEDFIREYPRVNQTEFALIDDWLYMSDFWYERLFDELTHYIDFVVIGEALQLENPKALIEAEAAKRSIVMSHTTRNPQVPNLEQLRQSAVAQSTMPLEVFGMARHDAGRIALGLKYRLSSNAAATRISSYIQALVLTELDKMESDAKERKSSMVWQLRLYQFQVAEREGFHTYQTEAGKHTVVINIRKYGSLTWYIVMQFANRWVCGSADSEHITRTLKEMKADILRIWNRCMRLLMEAKDASPETSFCELFEINRELFHVAVRVQIAQLCEMLDNDRNYDGTIHG